MMRFSRRRLASLGLTLAAVAGTRRADAATSLLPSGAATLQELTQRLAAASRRRDFAVGFSYCR